MHQLCYISTATPGVDVDVEAILAASRRNNRRAGLTGLLLFDGRRFLQVLEGDEGQVAAAFARIKADVRHRAVVTLSAKAVDARQFGDWDMAAEHVQGGRDGEALADAVDRLTTGLTDPNMRALFRSYARIDRAGA